MANIWSFPGLQTGQDRSRQTGPRPVARPVARPARIGPPDRSWLDLGSPGSTILARPVRLEASMEFLGLARTDYIQYIT